MHDVPDIQAIRALYARGVSKREIARLLSMSRKTVDKYTAEDYVVPEEPRMRTGQGRAAPKLDRWKATLEEWMAQDAKAPRKQRRTARKLYQDLVQEYGDQVDVSEVTVRRFVRHHRDAHREAFVGRVRAIDDRGELFLGDGPGLLDREHAELTDDAAPGASLGVSVLDQEGFRAARLDPDTEAADFPVPREVLAIRARFEGVYHALRQSGHGVLSSGWAHFSGRRGTAVSVLRIANLLPHAGAAWPGKHGGSSWRRFAGHRSVGSAATASMQLIEL